MIKPALIFGTRDCRCAAVQLAEAELQRYSFTVLYAVLRFINEWYAIVVLWIFVTAFVLALAFMFLFPQVTLGLFFIGLATLGVAVVVSGFLQSTQRLLARRKLSAGYCPRCGERVEPISHADANTRCSACGMMYTQTGGEIERRPPIETH